MFEDVEYVPNSRHTKSINGSIVQETLVSIKVSQDSPGEFFFFFCGSTTSSYWDNSEIIQIRPIGTRPTKSLDTSS